MEEDGLFLRYYVATKSRPPIRFIKELYMHYEGIKRIQLFYNSEDDTIFLNEKEDGRCEVKNCRHDDCTWHFVDWKIEMDWSDFPHPIFEVQNTLQHLRKLYPNESEAMVGQIYQYLIAQLSFFARYNSGTIIRSRSRFEEQAMDCGNEYLALTALTGNHKLPDKMPNPAATKNGTKKYTNLLVKYGKFNVRAKRNDPLLKRNKS